MPVLLAALSSVVYGTADFAGGLASRRNDGVVVTVRSQLYGCIVLVVVLLVWPDVTVTRETDSESPGLAWVVYSVPVAEWDAERYDAAHRSWREGFMDLCPPAAAEAFALGLR